MNENQWPDKLYINQNLIILIACYIGVAYADMNELRCLCCLSLVLFCLTALSIIATLIAYTIHYWRKKMEKKP